jgi:hypothetical protein
VTVLSTLRRTPSAGLLLVQLGGLLLYPWMESSPAARALLSGFGLLVLGMALRVVRRNHWLPWLSLFLAVPVVVLSVLSGLAPDPSLTVALASLEAAFYFYATGSMIAYMLEDPVATRDELFAAGAAFTLLAWGFAYAFVACQTLIPGSFGGVPDGEVPRTWMELLYLSVMVLSSVGLSDIVPAAPMARSLVMLEAVAGIMYIALVVSRLIGLTLIGRRPPA